MAWTLHRDEELRPLRQQVWLKQPLVCVGDITTRHDIVEAFVSDPELRERLRDQHLRGVSVSQGQSRVNHLSHVEDGSKSKRLQGCQM